MSTFVFHHKYDLYATNSMQSAYSWRISQKGIRSMHSSRRPKTAECFCTEDLRDGPGDHLHFLVLLSQEVTLSHLIKEIKRTSTLFLKECDGAYYHHFHWQSGYGGFSVSEKLKNVVYEYILRQEEHHKKRFMYDEFEMLLKNAGITQYENRYYWQ